MVIYYWFIWKEISVFYLMKFLLFFILFCCISGVEGFYSVRGGVDEVDKYFVIVVEILDLREFFK